MLLWRVFGRSGEGDVKIQVGDGGEEGLKIMSSLRYETGEMGLEMGWGLGVESDVVHIEYYK